MKVLNMLLLLMGTICVGLCVGYMTQPNLLVQFIGSTILLCNPTYLILFSKRNWIGWMVLLYVTIFILMQFMGAMLQSKAGPLSVYYIPSGSCAGFVLAILYAIFQGALLRHVSDFEE